jgi:hypothetical protein
MVSQSRPRSLVRRLQSIQAYEERAESWNMQDWNMQDMSAAGRLPCSLASACLLTSWNKEEQTGSSKRP